MAILSAFLLLALSVVALTTLLNSLTFPRLDRDRYATENQPNGLPGRVSILIPARDEASVIEASVQRHLDQEGVDFELLVLDDHSSDDTAQRALAAGRGDPRLRVLLGEAVPDGWGGKNWACHQLAQRAQGDLLVFTDADVLWQPGALKDLLGLMGKYGADMFTVWPTQQTVTWAERLVVPLMMFVVMGYLPEIAVRYLPLRAFSAANGQCLVFRRTAYERSGGHSSVRSAVVEDVALGRLVKKGGMRLAMALGNGRIVTRMYHNWVEVRNGFAKNILAGHGGRPILLMLSTLLHWSLFLFPWVWLLAGFFYPDRMYWPWIPLIQVMLGLGARTLSAAMTRQRVSDAIWMPVSVVLMTIIAFQALWWHYRYGGPLWKGRRMRTGPPASEEPAGGMDA